ncbi:MAG: class I SAM-dependent methyltransferase [Deltaproteobacteria bacterium]|nr:class I SAM-dependent methyltransferase [Deltaproteobacteria bacterium]
MKHKQMLAPVERFFRDKVREFGASHKAVDYNSTDAQEIRFLQLMKLLAGPEPFSINDYGCGYGALAHFLLDRGHRFTYCGLDIAKEMTDAAARLVPEGAAWHFVNDPKELAPADYTVVSGTFNLKLGAERAAWEEFVLACLEGIARVSRKGFGFNMLTTYSDRELMRPDLYYGDPLFYFDYCERNFSKDVALLHDYGIYDFTVLVRLQAPEGQKPEQ